jgi:hypothetical protein
MWSKKYANSPENCIYFLNYVLGFILTNDSCVTDNLTLALKVVHEVCVNSEWRLTN